MAAKLHPLLHPRQSNKFPLSLRLSYSYQTTSSSPPLQSHVRQLPELLPGLHVPLSRPSKSIRLPILAYPLLAFFFF